MRKLSNQKYRFKIDFFNGKNINCWGILDLKNGNMAIPYSEEFYVRAELNELSSKNYRYLFSHNIDMFKDSNLSGFKDKKRMIKKY